MLTVLYVFIVHVSGKTRDVPSEILHKIVYNHTDVDKSNKNPNLASFFQIMATGQK